MIHRTLRPLAAAALAVSLPAHAAADTAQLEARIAQLETQLAALLAERTAHPAPPAGAAPPATATGAGAAAAAPPPIQSSAILPNAPAGTRFTVSGFLRTDALLTATGDGEIADGGIGRDLYVPGQIPVGGLDEGTDLDALAKWSRIILGVDQTTDGGDTLAARLEFDLFGGALGNEQATNTYGLTVRHAWLGWNQWLFGQTWTNVFDPATLVDSVDIVGATDAQVFVRQAQVRWTRGPWSLSLENPETTIAPPGGGARVSSDDNNLPDLTARYTHKASWGQVSTALLARQLAWQTTGSNAVDDRRGALAASVSGKILLGTQDDLRFAVTGGQGIGRYVGLGIAADAQLDAAGDLDAVDGLAAYLAWRHAFSPRWRTSLYAAASRWDHDVARTGGAVTDRVHSLAANVFWTPVPKLDLGAELRYGERRLEDASEGDLRRVHLVARYAF